MSCWWRKDHEEKGELWAHTWRCHTASAKDERFSGMKLDGDGKYGRMQTRA